MRFWAVVAALSLSTAIALVAQNPSPSVAADRVVPRPPAREQGAPETGSTVTDGYAPIPQWLGQTRAPRPAKSEAFTVQTVVSGIGGGFSFHFLPDGRILISERPGRMRIASKDGALSEPIGGLPELYAGGPQGLFEVLPDRDFAKNRTIYFGYTALPSGPKPVVLPRLAGLLMIARARLSADDRRLEDVRVLLNAEGINGRMIQAPDGTLLITSGIPAGESIPTPAAQVFGELRRRSRRLGSAVRNLLPADAGRRARSTRQAGPPGWRRGRRQLLQAFLSDALLAEALEQGQTVSASTEQAAEAAPCGTRSASTCCRSAHA